MLAEEEKCQFVSWLMVSFDSSDRTGDCFWPPIIPKTRVVHSRLPVAEPTEVPAGSAAGDCRLAFGRRLDWPLTRCPARMEYCVGLMDASEGAMRLQSTLTVMSLNLAHGRQQWMAPSSDAAALLQANLAEVAGLIRRERPDVVRFRRPIAPLFGVGDSITSVSRRHGRCTILRSWRARQSLETDLRHGPPVAMLACRPGLPYLFPCLADLSRAWSWQRSSWPGATERQLTWFPSTLEWAERPCAASIPRDCRAIEEPKAASGADGRFQLWVRRPGADVGLVDGELNLRAYAPEAKGLNTFPLFNRRLDWILISPELDFVDYRTLSDVVSDHRPVVATLRWAKVRRCPEARTAFPSITTPRERIGLRGVESGEKREEPRKTRKTRKGMKRRSDAGQLWAEGRGGERKCQKISVQPLFRVFRGPSPFFFPRPTPHSPLCTLHSLAMQY